jgi:type IV secretion system protein VirB11
MVTDVQALVIKRAVKEAKTILIVGGTGSGKTTLLKAILEEIVEERLVVIEDTPEIPVIEGLDRVHYLTHVNFSMNDGIVASLRASADRIVLGEIRTGIVAQEWIKSCNTGHNGSLATIHANSAEEGVDRLVDLHREVMTGEPNRRSIEQTLDVVMFVDKKNGTRTVSEIKIKEE